MHFMSVSTLVSYIATWSLSCTFYTTGLYCLSTFLVLMKMSSTLWVTRIRVWLLSSKWFCESFSAISWYGKFCYCQCSSNVHIPFSHHDCAACSINGENKHYGTPVNPAAPSRIPGGSSSGSAVAVAADLVDFSLGIFSNWGIIGLMKYGSHVFFHSSNWVL